MVVVRPLRPLLSCPLLWLCTLTLACSTEQSNPAAAGGQGEPPSSSTAPLDMPAAGGQPAAVSGAGTSAGGSEQPPTAGATSGGSSGSATGGDAATGGSGGESPQEPVLSAGCGQEDPEMGESQIDVQGQPGVYYINVPMDYDPDNPYPLVFGFHGRNLDYKACLNANCEGLVESAGDEAVLVYMSSIGNGWEGDGERAINVEFFQTMLAKLKGEYCIDETRVFVTGSSSGAQFTNILACRFGDILRGAAPVAGATLEKDDCQGNVAAMVIHGVDDHHVTFEAGQDTRDFYLQRSGCSMETDVPLAELHQRVVDERESHECTAYQQCDPQYPVVWCEHSEGGYDGSTHGWPLFGGEAVWEFFSGLPR